MKNFEIKIMNTVVRGTRETFNYWKPGFAPVYLGDYLCSGDIKIGHKIIGPTISHLTYAEGQFDAKLLELMKELKRDSNKTKKEELKVWPRQIAILTREVDPKEVINILREEGYLAGSIEEQYSKQDKMIAVDYFLYSCSYDWAVVVLIHTWSGSMSTDLKFLPCSRAVSKLYLLTFKAKEEAALEAICKKVRVFSVSSPPPSPTDKIIISPPS